MSDRLIIHDLDRCSYDRAFQLQTQLLEKLIADASGPAHLLLVEHDPPVITLGRRARPENILADRADLAARGVEVREVPRGGDVTWHGPGQLVAYPIVPLAGRGVRRYVHDLEEAVIRLAGRLGIAAGREEGATGVWVGQAKLAAVGVAVRRWVAWHGLAINVKNDLSGFGLIVPCGLHRPVTSLERLLARQVEMDQVKAMLVEELSAVLGENRDRPHFSAQSSDASRSSHLPPAMAPVAAEEKWGASLFSRRRLPDWLVIKPQPVAQAGRVRRVLAQLGLATVCTSARCPNRSECFSRGTATFMILGEVCTRRCRFCAVGQGTPQPVRADEPAALAEAAAKLDLRHVVITSVTRDDLPDGGAGHFARTIGALRQRLPQAVVEVLVGDFAGQAEAIDAVLAAGPDVFNHNIETVPRLYPAVRPQADYRRSLGVLSRAAAARLPQQLVKSGLMVGLGETPAEVAAVMAELRQAGCDVLTIGQYLQPARDKLPVAEFIPPAQFDAYRKDALAMGFVAVAAGPFVRSSYNAQAVHRQAAARNSLGGCHGSAF